MVKKNAKKIEVYGYGRGILMLFGVLLIVLGIVLYARQDLLEEILAIMLVLYGIRKIIVGYKC